VRIRTALTIAGVSDGLASSIRATVPETTGAAKEVPLRIWYVPVARGRLALVSPKRRPPMSPPPPVSEE
jgi:hypothetical protein